MKKIYTIGYTSFNIHKFLEILKQYRIGCVIDVRSVPKSTYYIDFDSNVLSKVLRQHNILYRNYAKEFGARQDDYRFFPNKYLDFNLFCKSINFEEGINKIKKAHELNYVPCLMCAEKDPINCHRAIMVGKGLADRGFEVLHIMADGLTTSQEELTLRLLDMYFPRRNQLSFFSEDNKSKEEFIEEVYRLRNKDIGFTLEDE